MGWRGLTASARVVLLVLLTICAPFTPAYAGCSATDLASAIGTLISKFPVGCLDDPEFVIALPYVIGILQLPNGEGATVCSAIEAAGGDLSKANTLLSKSGISNVSALSDVSSLLSDAADASNIASCACQTAEDPGWPAFFAQFDTCLQQLFCTADNDCTGSSVNIQQIDCEISPCPPGSFNQIYNCGGTLQNPIPGIWGPAPAAGSMSGAPVTYQGTAAGVVVTQTQPGYSASGAETVYECFCPYPMQIGWSNAIDNTGSQTIDLPYLTCTCPPGTTAASAPGTSTPACLCDSGPLKGQAAPTSGECPTSGSTTGCPTGEIESAGKCVASCPAGEEASAGKCVASGCSDPTKIQLANGSCCDPAQASSCGTCCPSGQRPDPATGNCISPRQPPNLR